MPPGRRAYYVQWPPLTGCLHVAPVSRPRVRRARRSPAPERTALLRSHRHSLQVNHPALGVRVALDIALRRRQRYVAGEFLHVAERTAGLNDLLGATGDERPTAAMAGRALEAKLVVVEPMKPHFARRRATCPHRARCE